jgi:hypothetical protein
MVHRGIVLLSALLVSLSLPAQVTIQHGNTLSELINNLYGGDGIQLASNGHDAHFGQTQDFQNFTKTLQAVLQSRTFFPIPSAVGLVSYRFNETTGTYERVEGSMGPILAERGSTTGKGNLNFSATYTFADYQNIAGKNTAELVLHHCLTLACTGGNLNQPFLNDTVHVDVHFRLKSQAVALSVVYGINNRLDIGVVVPYIRNDLQVFTHAFVVVAPGSNPLTHRFDPVVETPDQSGTATAVGIGDTILRGKMRLLPKATFDSAVLVDLTLPTGEKQNFLGNGRTKLKATYIVSKPIRRFTPHLNAAYELTFSETKLNTFEYRLGTEVLATPRLTLATDMIGVVRPHGTSLFQSAALGNESLIGRSESDGVIGGKWKMSADRAFLFNLLVPLNSTGIRPTYVVTAGLQLSL